MTAEVPRKTIEEFIKRNLKFPEYLALFLKSPRTMIERQLNKPLPPDVEITVLQETPNTVYIVLPYEVPTGVELSDEDLEHVAGGKGGNTYTCNVEGAGMFNTKID